MGLWLADKKTVRLARHGRYGYSVKAWERFFDAERAEGRLDDRVVLADLNKATVERFIDHRLGAGMSGETVQGDISAMRRCLSFALEEELIETAPKIVGVDPKDRPGPRQIEFDMEQVAAILEAAARLPDRRHVLLFAMIMLSTHARAEAVLELYSHQIEEVPVVGGEVRRIINFNSAGRKQTTKRRSRVPVCSALVPWLRDIDGKVITYRAPIAERKWADAAVPEYFERPCADIGNAFEACLVEAGLAHPTLGLIAPVLGDDGHHVSKLNKRTGEAVLQWRGIGTPNTLRHTCHTYHQMVGTPQAQIDMAAGHSAEQGSGRNYTHLRPEYLREFMAATEAYWEAMGKLTQAHLRDRAAGVVVPLRRG